ncbi:MAG TPA: hypothetical protein DIU15_18100, partial [Deltaproteobacteria bacterium]|nr:hypothetical protein [Deltaproteobacteria bacterium]
MRVPHPGWLPILAGLALCLLAGCSLEFDPSSVHCESDDHCPDGYFCSGSLGAEGLCIEGPDDDDTGG